MRKESMSEKDARARNFRFGSSGLIESRPKGISPKKKRYAHDAKATVDLVEAIDSLKATILVDASTVGDAFTKGVVGVMAKINTRAMIFALS